MQLKKILCSVCLIGFFGALLVPLPPAAAQRGGEYEWIDPIVVLRRILLDGYYEQPDEEAIQQAMLAAMVSVLDDPYTVYVPPAAEVEFNKAMRGTYVGIGAEIDIVDDYLTIVSPLEDSPALGAGVKAGDIVLEIEGASTIDRSIDECIGTLLGEPGTPVSIRVRHLDGTEEALTIERREIVTPTVKGVQRVGENELLQSPVLFVCTAISAFEEVISKIGTKLSPGTLLIDTCSVKSHPVAVMEKNVPEGVEILATHPMFGPDSARDGFDGLPMVMCPVRIEEKRLAKWKSFFQSLGLKILIMTPQQHDREAAFTQGITHFVGRVLADLDLKDSSMATLGYRKLLEIREQTCNDPWQLFLDLQRLNPYTEEMRKSLGRSLTRILEQLER